MKVFVRKGYLRVQSILVGGGFFDFEDFHFQMFIAIYYKSMSW